MWKRSRVRELVYKRYRVPRLVLGMDRNPIETLENPTAFT